MPMLPVMHNEALEILKSQTAEAIHALADCGLSEMKDRLERVIVHDPLVHSIWTMIAAYEDREGIQLPREDRYVMLAYHALCGKLEAEQQLVEQIMVSKVQSLRI